MEGFTCTRLLPQLNEKIDPRQYARKGHSTTDALLYMLQAIYEAVDSGDFGARMFFADFSKGFDLIDHNILISVLNKLDISGIILKWISAFLVNRTQAVSVGGTLFKSKFLKGGIPQGTKLGIVLFAVMTNSLLADWHLRTKFVDDTSVAEILPRNLISVLNMAVFSTQDFAVTHNMKLNPRKCKEMVINFMNNPNFLINPIVIEHTTVQRVASYKLLGVFIDDDVKWNTHVDHIYKKACKRLYSLRLLKKADVTATSILKVYVSIIRPILEYAVPVWQAISEKQSEKLESIQKRALRIIFPSVETYAEALSIAHLETLKARRLRICEKHMDRMKCINRPLNMLQPKRSDKGCKYALRDKSEEIHVYKDHKFCNTKRITEEFFTFKYFKFYKYF